MGAKGSKHRPVADGDCLTCHNPHASRWKGLLAASPVVLCGRCHADTIRRQERSAVKHTPMQQGECTTCHDPHASDQPLLFTQASVLEGCGACHDFKGHQAHPIGGELVDPRNRNLGIDCLSCHRAHGTDFKRLFPYPTNQELCTKCHQALMR
jgi:predicted CXXCH cytochrome family protein